MVVSKSVHHYSVFRIFYSQIQNDIHFSFSRNTTDYSRSLHLHTRYDTVECTAITS